MHKIVEKCRSESGEGSREGSRGRVGIPYNTALGSKVPGSVSSEICDNFFSD